MAEFEEMAKTAETAEIIDSAMKLVSTDIMKSIKMVDVNEEILAEVLELGTEMIKFTAAKNGVGLASIQVGLDRKFGVFLDNEEWVIVINPTYMLGKKKVNIMERNLSYEGEILTYERYKTIRAIYYTIDFKDGDLKMKKVARNMHNEKSYLFQSLTDMINGKIPTEKNFFKKEEK